MASPSLFPDVSHQSIIALTPFTHTYNQYFYIHQYPDTSNKVNTQGSITTTTLTNTSTTTLPSNDHTNFSLPQPNYQQPKPIPHLLQNTFITFPQPHHFPNWNTPNKPHLSSCMTAHVILNPTIIYHSLRHQWSIWSTTTMYYYWTLYPGIPKNPSTSTHSELFSSSVYNDSTITEPNNSFQIFLKKTIYIVVMAVWPTFSRKIINKYHKLINKQYQTTLHTRYKQPPQHNYISTSIADG